MHIKGLYRVWSYVRKPLVQEWAAVQQFLWNTISKRSDVITVALLRSLKIDLAKSNGLISIAGLIDIKKFFDSIKVADLIRAGFDLGFHPVVL